MLAQLYPVRRSHGLEQVTELRGHRELISDLIQLGDGSIASASEDHTIRIWPLDGGRPRVLAGHTDWVVHLIQLADGRIASASADRAIRVWPLDGGRPLVLAGHRRGVWQLIQLADRRISSASEDGIIRIWGSSTADLLRVAVRQAKLHKAKRCMLR